MKKGMIYALIIVFLVIVLVVMLYLSLNDNSTSNNYLEENNGSSISSTSTNENKITVSGKVYSASNLFTDSDLEQTADLTDAKSYTLADGEDINITEEGVYVLKGTAKNVTIYVEAATDAKVQIVLDEVSITNSDFPCIYVKSGDKIFITSNGENSLAVTGTFKADGDTNTDGVIFSKSDITLNGTGTLNINSTDNGIVGKDDLKVTGGTYNIIATSKTFEANDSIRISDGTFNLTAGTDGLHSENEEDSTLGYIYISGGEFSIKAGDDAIHGNSVVQMDDGTFTITAAEAIEGTYIQINGGTINITASDDGINAANKSDSYNPTFEINDGNVTISMGAGDTDGVDSNGDIIINGGTISVTGNSTFDYDGNGTINGGTVIINGETVDILPNQMMGGRGGHGTQMNQEDQNFQENQNFQGDQNFQGGQGRRNNR